MNARSYPCSPATEALLRNPPKPGGRHRWLLKVAGGLHRTLSPERCYAFLLECRQYFDATEPLDEAEIRGVVEYVYHSGDGRKPAPSFLGPDANRIREVLDTVEPLFDGVTDTGLTAADVLPRLFRPDELVCTGPDTYTAQVRPTEKAAVDTGEQQFICCNPMRAIWAQTGTGKFSSRCQNNVLLRRYLVAEFDDIELTKQHQAQLATALAKGASLVMVVDSGHKSLHCWFYVEDLSPQDQIRFFTVACVLGADPSRFDSCAWLRMPGGLRINDGTRGRQRILFFSNARTYQKEGAE